MALFIPFLLLVLAHLAHLSNALIPLPLTSPHKCGSLLLGTSVKAVKDCRPGKFGRLLVLQITSDCVHGTMAVGFCRELVHASKALKKTRTCLKKRLSDECHALNEAKAQRRCVRKEARKCNLGMIMIDEIYLH